jgi:hypothetical protein
MTPDQFDAALDQLAVCREAIAGLDARESAHFAELDGQVAQLASLVTTISRTLTDGAAAMARVDALDRQIAQLSGQPADPGGSRDAGYQPGATPPWWKLTRGERRAPVAELRNWVEHVYRPGYGHLATLAPCWPEHDLCLYGLDLLSQLWCALYLQPERTADLLSAQAEYQARILPALAAQMTAETTHCGHPTIATRPGARP